MLDLLDDYTRIALAVAGLLAALVGWMRWVRPRWRRFRADSSDARDALIGRPAVRDSITGKELSPALPGIGSRMAVQEAQMQVMAQAVARLAESHDRLNDHQEQLDDHQLRIATLEQGAAERIVSRVDSIAAWEAMQAAVEANPDRIED